MKDQAEYGHSLVKGMENRKMMEGCGTLVHGYNGCGTTGTLVHGYMGA